MRESKLLQTQRENQITAQALALAGKQAGVSTLGRNQIYAWRLAVERREEYELERSRAESVYGATGPDLLRLLKERDPRRAERLLIEAAETRGPIANTDQVEAALKAWLKR